MGRLRFPASGVISYLPLCFFFLSFFFTFYLETLMDSQELALDSTGGPARSVAAPHGTGR